MFSTTMFLRFGLMKTHILCVFDESKEFSFKDLHTDTEFFYNKEYKRHHMFFINLLCDYLMAPLLLKYFVFLTNFTLKNTYNSGK